MIVAIITTITALHKWPVPALILTFLFAFVLTMIGCLTIISLWGQYDSYKVSASEAPKLRQDLWTLWQEGVNLRNEPIRPDQHREWYGRFDNWHRRTIEKASRLDSELKVRVSTLNEVPHKELNLLWVNPESCVKSDHFTA
ncbi:MAG: hypothetical protein ACREJU_04350, partial [Nitrospiraceae bacterium]